MDEQKTTEVTKESTPTEEPKKVKRRGILRSIGDRMLAADEENLKKATEDLLRKEEEFYQQTNLTRTASTDERIAMYKEEQKKLKEQKKGLLYRISGIRPMKVSFFHPLTRTTEHQVLEEWWFSLPDAQRKMLKEMMRLKGIKKNLATHVLDYAEYETRLDEENQKLTAEGKTVKPRLRLDFYKYWFIYVALGIILLGLIVNFRLQSPLIALIGACLCAVILYYSQMLRVRRSLGLKIFCPVTIGWLKVQYASAHPMPVEAEENKTMRKKDKREKRNAL